MSAVTAPVDTRTEDHRSPDTESDAGHLLRDLHREDRRGKRR